MGTGSVEKDGDASVFWCDIVHAVLLGRGRLSAAESRSRQYLCPWVRGVRRTFGRKRRQRVLWVKLQRYPDLPLRVHQRFHRA